MRRVLFFLLIMALFRIGWCAEYFICVEGGGTKTRMAILDQQGNPLSLKKGDWMAQEVSVSASNISEGRDCVDLAIQTLFKDLKVGEEERELSQILPECKVIAGMAGLNAEEQFELVRQVFQKQGIEQHQLHLMSDGDLALQLFDQRGALLIAGTGSICLGIKEGNYYRVGGLGRILGDEGSGYFIGLQALKAGLADEYGWGKQTELRGALCELFGLKKLNEAIQPVTRGEWGPSQVARAAPIVFELAFRDEVAASIIEEAAAQLRSQLMSLLEQADLSHCEIHLYGGIFKSYNAEKFMKKITDDRRIQARHVRVILKEDENPAVLFVQKNIRGRTGISPYPEF